MSVPNAQLVSQLTSRFGPQFSESLLRRLDEARRAWPTLDVDPAIFLGRIAEEIAADEDRDRSLSNLHVADLYLATACACGSPTGQAALDRGFLTSLNVHLKAIDTAPHFVDEVRQDLLSKLFLPSTDGPPKIATYSGRGPLAGFLRVAAIRTARNMKRGTKKTVDVSDRQLGGMIASSGESPELSYLKSHGARVFHESFENVLRSLGARDQALLRLTYVEKMSSQDIGRMYGVTGAAVRVWLKKIRDDVIARMRTELGAQFEADSQELRELVGLVQSRFDLTLSRVLAQEEFSSSGRK